MRKVPGEIVEPTTVRYDWWWATGGALDMVPTTGGSSGGWGEWFVTTVLNDTGNDLYLNEFGWPCCGPPTGVYGWVVWVNVGGIVPPGGASSADYYGSYAPVDPAPDTFPPVTYTYIGVTAENIVIPPSAYMCFGYDNTGNGGQILFNGTQTWAWYSGYWDPDESWDRTALLQVKASFTSTPVEDTSWGHIKGLYR